MSAGSRIIVNNRVMLSGAAGHSAIGGSRLLYIANRPGAVTLKTEDDLRIERENERMAKLGYIEFRPGSVAERNSGHALFDASGVPVRAALQSELRETKSAIITSVVSVRREDAEALRLSTKQDWERLLRSQWPRYMESLGVMEAQDVRWCAAFHCNQANNLHCHVFTWDVSGRFDELLPKQAMARANEALQAHVLRPQQEELNLRRTLARDELTAALRSGELGPELRQRTLSALPDKGSLKYASLCKRHPEAAQCIRSAVADQVKTDSHLAGLHAEYLAAVRNNADLKALAPDARESYIHAAEADLNTRLANALIANVRTAQGQAPKPRALERREPAPIAKPNAENQGPLLLPSERRQSQALVEEAHSCLRAEEREALSSALHEPRLNPTLRQKAVEALRKLPSIKRLGIAACELGQRLQKAVEKNRERISSALPESATAYGGRSRSIGYVLRAIYGHLQHPEPAAQKQAEALAPKPTIAPKG